MPLVVVFYSFLLLPPEVSTSVFGVNLSSFRVALLVTAAPSLWIMLRDGERGFFLDYAVMFMGFWIMLSFMTIYGVETGAVRGLGVIIDNVLAYLVARASIRRPDELRYFLLLCLPALLFAGTIMIFESIYGKFIYRPIFISIFGSLDSYKGGEAAGSMVLNQELRLGLLRALGPFPHPILAGTSMVGFFPLFYFAGLRFWPYLLGIFVAIAGLFSLSSAAFLSLFIVLAAVFFHHAKAYFKGISWWTITGLLAVATLALQVVVNGGIISVISRLTLNSGTAFYRTLIWQFGTDSVAKHPWFGIGYNDWERVSWMVNDSVDAHFLLLAMRHGLIVPVVLLFGIAVTMVRLGLIMPALDPRNRAMMLGVSITVLVYVVVGQTVNFFGSAALIFMTMVGILASMTQWANNRVRSDAHQRMMLQRIMFYASRA